MVNKESHKKVLDHYKITLAQLGTKARINHYQSLIFNVFDDIQPDLTKYRANLQNQSNIRTALQDENSILSEDLTSLKAQIMKEQDVQYYTFHNVKLSGNTFFDVEILSTSKNKSSDSMKYWSERSKILEDLYNKKPSTMPKLQLKNLENDKASSKTRSAVDVLFQEAAYNKAMKRMQTVDERDNNGKKQLSARERQIEYVSKNVIIKQQMGSKANKQNAKVLDASPETRETALRWENPRNNSTKRSSNTPQQKKWQDQLRGKNAKKLAQSKSPKKFKYHEMVKSGKVNHDTPKASKGLNRDLAPVINKET